MANSNIDVKNFKPKAIFKGMSLFDAIKLVQDKMQWLKYDIVYDEKYGSNLNVRNVDYDKSDNTVVFYVGTLKSFKGLLPEIYEENSFFLDQFLMVFQHIINGRTMILDNIDKFFSPMKAPKFFLPVLAAWFNIDLSLFGNREDVVRKMIQFAIPIYKLRGTKKGLRLLLYILTGVIPDIIEGAAPFTEMTISNKVQVDSPIFGNSKEKFSFYVYFPILESEFDGALVENIHRMVQKEKPAYMKAYVCFKRPKKIERKITTFEDGMDTLGEDGVYF